MTAQTATVPQGTLMRWILPQGTVYALVRDAGATAVVQVYEEGAALKVRDEIGRLGESPSMEAARNRFGVKTMLGVCREIVARWPSVREWRFRRVSGGNACRDGKVRV